MNPQTKTLLITSCVFGALVTVMVLVNTPSLMEAQQRDSNKSIHLIKVFMVSTIMSALVLYIMQDNDQNAMMTNIIKGEPDF